MFQEGFAISGKEFRSRQSVGDGLAIDRHEVTNAQFAAFVTAIGYVTFAERPVDPALYPGAPPHLVEIAAEFFSQSNRVIVRPDGCLVVL